MKLKKTLVFLLILGAFLLQACGPGVEAAIATAIAETQQISQLQTAAAGGGGGAQVQPTITETPGPGLAFVSVSQNTNCRSGPNTSYSVLTTVNIGQQVEVLKVFSSEYVLVRNPNGTGDCWLFLRYADVTDFNSFNLEVATQPPTPQLTNTTIASNTPLPPFDWSGTWILSVNHLPDESSYTGSMTCTVNGSSLSCAGTLNNEDEEASLTGSATLSSSLQNANGSFDIFDYGPLPWAGQIKSDNPNQFVGNWLSGGWSFCGSRSGAPMPSPCLGP